MSSRGIHVGVDASNIRQGGGIVHLAKMLSAADPDRAGIARFTVWGAASALAKLPNQPWLIRRHPAWASSNIIMRGIGQQLLLPAALAAHGCDVLFSPGGTIPLRCPCPTVTMAQNMLPFCPSQARLFGRWSAMRLKFRLLRLSQGRSFRAANGVIFPTTYARDIITDMINNDMKKTVVIAHGIEKRFFQEAKTQKPIDDYGQKKTFKILYVSIVMPYKHQYEVAKAAAMLRDQGLPIDMHFIGASWGSYGRDFNALLARLDPDKSFLFWSKEKPFNELHKDYQNADMFIHASSCESISNILLEAMASALPIAAANCRPMTDILGKAGMYFQPSNNPRNIAQTLHKMIASNQKRADMATKAKKLSMPYAWKRCADETLAFIVAASHRQVSQKSAGVQ